MKPSKSVVIVALLFATASACRTGSNDNRLENVASGHAWRIRLSWTTETESNSFGFFVYRSDRKGGEMRVLNPDAPVPAAGTTTTPQRYRFYDLDVAGGRTYFYKLEQVDLDGSRRFIVGDPVPVAGKSKPLTAEEAAEIQSRGLMFRVEGG